MYDMAKYRSLARVVFLGLSLGACLLRIIVGVIFFYFCRRYCYSFITSCGYGSVYATGEIN